MLPPPVPELPVRFHYWVAYIIHVDNVAERASHSVEIIDYQIENEKDLARLEAQINDDHGCDINPSIKVVLTA